MKKKIILALLCVFVFENTLKACGGCIDSFYPAELATLSKTKFNLLETKLAQKIEEITEKLSKAFNDMEEYNLNEIKTLSALKKYQSLRNKEEKFLIEQNNRLQSLANELRGVKY